MTQPTARRFAVGHPLIDLSPRDKTQHSFSRPKFVLQPEFIRFQPMSAVLNSNTWTSSSGRRGWSPAGTGLTCQSRNPRQVSQILAHLHTRISISGWRDSSQTAFVWMNILKHCKQNNSAQLLNGVFHGSRNATKYTSYHTPRLQL